ncbi:MAG: hypothetical protein BroJett040_02980 [Oligoflexia bacterium]|nr:MAG: hypothetical protein BroJett040_02980 [Oligoflexia bacterium]
MQEKQPSELLERDIRQLLIEGPSAEVVCEKLIEKYGNTALTRAEFEILSVFFLRVGNYIKLNELLTRAVSRNLAIPWGHYCESIFSSTQIIPGQVKTALIEGATEQRQLHELSRSHFLDQFDESLPTKRKERRELQQKKHLEKKQEMLIQAETLRSQGLYENEGKLLERMRRFFPDDPEVAKQLNKRKQQLALGVLNDSQAVPETKKTRRKPPSRIEKLDPESLKILSTVLQRMNEALGEIGDEELKKDFMIAHLMWENYEASLSFMPELENTQSAEWLRLELLLAARRYVDLLNELIIVESKWSKDPEATFGILYLRAQALWGLGQSVPALKILESIQAVRPNYRACSALLAEWREELL